MIDSSEIKSVKVIQLRQVINRVKYLKEPHLRNILNNVSTTRDTTLLDAYDNVIYEVELMIKECEEGESE